MPSHRTDPRASRTRSDLTTVRASAVVRLAAISLALTSFANAQSDAVSTSPRAPDAPQAEAWEFAQEIIQATGPWLARQSESVPEWVRALSPLERVCWGALVACGFLGILLIIGRLNATRRGRVLPRDFRGRFLPRFREGKFDWSQGVDYCDLNPSPAARMTATGLRNWRGAPSSFEEQTARARQLEVASLRKHTNSLPRIAIYAGLIGLLGSLATAERVLRELPSGAIQGAALTPILLPLTCAVGLAILALVAYDGLSGRIEALATEMEQVSASVLEGLMAQETANAARGSTIARRDDSHPSEPHARSAQWLSRPPASREQNAL